ncbi:MAG: hypothetical protein QMC81_07625 [Thermoanaerobacterales bacterium]|nr:hypothetical protein [Bacillota bacterium]MDI6907338.1 hypothetical protein [Thermoanaerobacterales bacterium]
MRRVAHEMEGHLRLGAAVLKEVVRDISRGPYGPDRSSFLSAVGFLRSPLFAVICDGLGMDHVVAKKRILALSGSKGQGLQALRSKRRWRPRREWTISRQRLAN